MVLFAYMKTLTIVNTGEKISFKSIRLDMNIRAFSIDATIEMLNYLDFQKLNSVQEIDFDYLGKETFRLLVEPWDSTSSRGGVSESFTIKARSPAALLDFPHSDKLTQTFTNTTAQTIVQDLCNNEGVILDWQVIDWAIKSYDASNVSPISFIKKLVGAGGINAILQSSNDGKLIVCYRDKQSPANYSAPDFTITDKNYISPLSESIDLRKKYDYVSIGNESTGSTKPKVTIKTVQDGTDILIKVYVNPFQSIELNHAGLSFIDAVYQGVFTESITDENVKIISGKGSLSQNFYGLQSAVYYYSGLGALTTKEDGSFTTATDGHSLIDVVFTSKYHLFRVSGGEKTLAWIEALV